MIQFRDLTLEDIPAVRKFFEAYGSRSCDVTIGGAFMWRRYFETQVYMDDTLLLFKVMRSPGKIAFLTPYGDTERGIRLIFEYCMANDVSAAFCAVTDRELRFYEANYHVRDVAFNRTWSDYLYEAERHRTFAGKKLSGQRNHVNKFLKTYDNWSYEGITKENLAEVRAFCEEIGQLRAKESDTYDAEQEILTEVFEHLDEYGFFGNVLRVDGVIVAMAMGEIIGDTLFIHIEKARRDYFGAFQMNVREFAKAHTNDEVCYINREDDSGDEGLRMSKLSYQPCELLHKATIKLTWPE